MSTLLWDCNPNAFENNKHCLNDLIFSSPVIGQGKTFHRKSEVVENWKLNPPLRNGLRGDFIEKRFNKVPSWITLSSPLPFISSNRIKACKRSELKFQKLFSFLKMFFDGWEGKHFCHSLFRLRPKAIYNWVINTNQRWKWKWKWK